MEDDDEPRRKRLRPSTASCSVSGSKQGVVKHGYVNVTPITIRNIFNKSGQVIPCTLKWQKCVDLDFSKNQNPYIIPYEIMIFWKRLENPRFWNSSVSVSVMGGGLTGVVLLELVYVRNSCAGLCVSFTAEQPDEHLKQAVEIYSDSDIPEGAEIHIPTPETDLFEVATWTDLSTTPQNCFT